MPWLKYQASYAAGLGEPEYVEFSERDDLDNLKDEIFHELDDGIRTPKFEVLEALPPEVLESKIAQAERLTKSWAAQHRHLIKQRRL